MRVDWTGEGLPPVGTVCEWKGSRGGYWVACEVIAVSDKQFVLRHAHSGKYRPGQFEVFQAEPLQIQFRPLRTPEQIAAEGRAKSVEGICEIIKQAHYRLASTDVSPSIKAWAYAEALHGAGYRLPAKP